MTALALAGFGTVGSSLPRVAPHRAPDIRRVLVRDLAKPRRGAVRAEAFTADVESFLATPSTTVVELIGGTDTARRVVTGALRAGRHVVTANKALLALEGPELLALAASQALSLEFEAAVGGEVPVVHALRRGGGGRRVRSVTGVLNGTCNFVLDRLGAGVGFDEAVAEAQAAGYAEADPTRDLDGRDAEDKIRVLSWLAFGVHPQAVAVDRRGLDRDIGARARAVAREGGALKLLAGALREDDGSVRAWVRPVALPARWPLAQARGAQNVVQVEYDGAPPLTLAGEGAGGEPTARAVAADLRRVEGAATTRPTR